jgi:hypothetical protein
MSDETDQSLAALSGSMQTRQSPRRSLLGIAVESDYKGTAGQVNGLAFGSRKKYSSVPDREHVLRLWINRLKAYFVAFRSFSDQTENKCLNFLLVVRLRGFPVRTGTFFFRMEPGENGRRLEILLGESQIQKCRIFGNKLRPA